MNITSPAYGAPPGATYSAGDGGGITMAWVISRTIGFWLITSIDSARSNGPDHWPCTGGIGSSSVWPDWAFAVATTATSTLKLARTRFIPLLLVRIDSPATLAQIGRSVKPTQDALVAMTNALAEPPSLTPRR